MAGVRLKSVNPESVFLRRTRAAYANHKRRAAKYGYALPYTLEALRKWLPAFPFPCEYCPAVLTEATFCLDHAWPVGRRVDAGTWELRNLVPCCARCNEVKDRLTRIEFTELMDLVLNWPPSAQMNVLARLRAGARRVAGK